MSMSSNANLVRQSRALSRGPAQALPSMYLQPPQCSSCSSTVPPTHHIVFPKEHGDLTHRDSSEGVSSSAVHSHPPPHAHPTAERGAAAQQEGRQGKVGHADPVLRVSNVQSEPKGQAVSLPCSSQGGREWGSVYPAEAQRSAASPGWNCDAGRWSSHTERTRGEKRTRHKSNTVLLCCCATTSNTCPIDRHANTHDISPSCKS